MTIRVGAAVAAFALVATAAAAERQDPHQLARDLFKQLVEIKTTESGLGSTPAAEAMAQRLRAGGFAAEDVQVVGPGGRKQNLVARLKGTGRKRPVLLIGHLDVVEALREDWTVDPFVFLEKDGYFYGRGTQDMAGARSTTPRMSVTPAESGSTTTASSKVIATATTSAP